MVSSTGSTTSTVILIAITPLYLQTTLYVTVTDTAAPAVTNLIRPKGPMGPAMAEPAASAPSVDTTAPLAAAVNAVGGVLQEGVERRADAGNVGDPLGEHARGKRAVLRHVPQLEGVGRGRRERHRLTERKTRGRDKHPAVVVFVRQREPIRRKIAVFGVLRLAGV